MVDEPGSLLQRYLLLVQALRDPLLSKGDCQVLAMIGKHVGKSGEAWPGINRIADGAGIHRATVLRSVSRLEAFEYIAVCRIRGRSNLYNLASPSSTDATSASSTHATSRAMPLVARTHTTSSADATTPVAPTLPDQSHPCDPNSALELDSKNSVQRTQPFGLSLSAEEQQAEEQQRSPETEPLTGEALARRREQARNIYKAAQSTGNTLLMQSIVDHHGEHLDGLIEVSP